MKILILLLCIGIHTSAFGAESDAVAESASDIETKTETDTKTEQNTKTETTASAPKDTLGGDGLKRRKLSDIFEQFVPTETISADNAVPFPVDI